MKSVLIIEDHVGLREAYELLFVKEGYKVELAENGKAGLDLATKATYDLILLDMLMPEMSGIEFLRAYKPLDHPETKVIAFSNMQTPEMIKEAMELGVKRYMTKAIMPPQKMAEVVRELLGE